VRGAPTKKASIAGSLKHLMVGRADLRLRFANPRPRGRLPPSARALGYKQAAGLFA